MNIKLKEQLAEPGIINDLVKEYGYEFLLLCNCNNTRTIKFVKGKKRDANKFELSYMIHRGLFSLKRNGRTLHAAIPISKAPLILAELHAEQFEAA